LPLGLFPNKFEATR